MQNWLFVISDLFNLRSNTLYYICNIDWKKYFLVKKVGKNNADD